MNSAYTGSVFECRLKSCSLAMIVVAVLMAPVPVFLLLIIASTTKIPVISMRLDFPPLVVHYFGAVPVMVVSMFLVEDANPCCTARSNNKEKTQRCGQHG